MKNKILNWFWFDTPDYSTINGEIKFWQRNWITGYSRLKDTFTGTEIINLSGDNTKIYGKRNKRA